ncbi:MAG: hypothetical protein RXO22_02730 [Thermocladium sp.]
MMKALAAVLHEFNKPLSLEYIDLNPGPGEVIVKVKASGICGRDIVDLARRIQIKSTPSAGA